MDGTSGIDILQARFDAQRQAFSFGAVPSVEERRAKLDTLVRLVRAYQDKIVHAIDQDFGSRASAETRSGEIAPTISMAQDLKKNLKAWSSDRTFFKPLSSIPGKTYVQRVPKGVVGVISPWNYPFQLAVIPAATALAAGNRVMIKPSELTPRTAQLMAEMFAEGFSETEVAVVTGGPEVGEAFSRLPFDHLFYTGSTRIGRLVAVEAARNLTPVTLELGGKSPCLMMPDARPDKHAMMVAMGKWYNAGQTCTAPDYVLVPRGQAEGYASALLKHVGQFYGDPGTSEDYTAVISDAHRERLEGLVADAEARGATVRRAVADEGAMAGPGKMAPVVMWDVPGDAKVMAEEVFGPVLPIVEYDGVDDAVAYVTARDHPLALYVFGQDEEAAKGVLARTTSGGAAINATVIQVGIEHLPFGGVGASGYGAYHGEAGFREFSHERSVLVFPQAAFIQKMLTPPYGKAFEFVTKKAIGK